MPHGGIEAAKKSGQAGTASFKEVAETLASKVILERQLRSQTYAGRFYRVHLNENKFFYRITCFGYTK